jgi:hypothetical protein
MRITEANPASDSLCTPSCFVSGNGGTAWVTFYTLIMLMNIVCVASYFPYFDIGTCNMHLSLENKHFSHIYSLVLNLCVNLIVVEKN